MKRDFNDLSINDKKRGQNSSEEEEHNHQHHNNGNKHLLLQDDKFDSLFNPKILQQEFRDQLKHDIANAEPFNWGLITDLIDDTLLRSIRKEVETEIHFTEKETDMYKVNQSGDLANLSSLTKTDLKRLPSLFKLREILYSDKFRDFISYITDCGDLSGSKLDLSVNTYKKGCHLLNHDDVIGSRRVSYILYLPQPDRTWKEHYGGGLRLFPSVASNVPHPDPAAKLVPQFNQFAFFKVQPGYSWHDVEEVKVDKHRLSIQGWYHIPQVGDKGYQPGEEENYIKKNEELAILDSPNLKKFEYPKSERTVLSSVETIDLKLNDEDLANLSEFISEEYLNPTKLGKLNENFFNNSFISVDNFLNESKSNLLQKLIKLNELNEKIPTKSTEVQEPWNMARPPHKWQFLYLSQDAEDYKTELEREFIDLANFFKSLSFKKFIINITNLIPLTQSILIRRFRPGYDYTFANKPELNKALDDVLDCVLEGTLSLTLFDGWANGQLGGYQLYMSNEEEEDKDELTEDQVAYMKDNSGEDSVLINKPASWNSFTLVLRDEDVLEFVKYVSFNAKGSRWDINMNWDVKETEEEEEEEEEE